jgi:hypothetical protein
MIAAIPWSSIEFWAMLSGWVQALAVIVALFYAAGQVKGARGQIAVTQAEGKVARTIAIIDLRVEPAYAAAANRLESVVLEEGEHGHAAAGAKNLELYNAFWAAKLARAAPAADANQVVEDFGVFKNYISMAFTYFDRGLVDRDLLLRSLAYDFVDLFLLCGPMMKESNPADFEEFRGFALTCQQYLVKRGDQDDREITETKL